MRKITKKPFDEMTQRADCVFGPDVKPIATVVPGEVVEIETYDCFANVVSPQRPWKQIWESGEELFENPVTGPIYVEGTEPGDTLMIEILGIEVAEHGVTALVPGFGALEGWLTQVPPLSKFSEVRDGKIVFTTAKGKTVRIPVQPMIGTIGVAPANETVTTVTPSKHGGNLDAPWITTGSRLHLPVTVKGALFGLGDVHARQGEGEVCGTGVEVPALVKVRFEVLKDKRIEWPRIESSEEIMTVCSARPLEDAARLATRELVRWITADYGVDEYDAYMLVSIVGDLRIAQIVDPLYTVAAKIGKGVLSQLK
jgi:acetamidase/formamidase